MQTTYAMPAHRTDHHAASFGHHACATGGTGSNSLHNPYADLSLFGHEEDKQVVFKSRTANSMAHTQEAFPQLYCGGGGGGDGDYAALPEHDLVYSVSAFNSGVNSSCSSINEFNRQVRSSSSHETKTSELHSPKL